MDAISQTIFSNAFSWMKMFPLRLKCHCSLLPRVQLTIFQHWFRSDNGLAPSRRQAIIWINDGSVYRRIYASLGLNELTCTVINKSSQHNPKHVIMGCSVPLQLVNKHTIFRTKIKMYKIRCSFWNKLHVNIKRHTRSFGVYHLTYIDMFL